MFSKSLNKPERDNTSFPPTMLNPPHPPMKKEFQTILEMVKDAEKYHRNNETDVCISVLSNVCAYIERFTSSCRQEHER